MILPNIGSSEAMVVAERIRSRVASTVVELAPGKTDTFTVSIGIASAPSDARDRVELLRIADAALYQAKTHGRNRCLVAGESFSERVDGVPDGNSDAPPITRRRRRTRNTAPIELKRVG